MMETGDRKFWMVYGLHQRGPVYRHKSEASAIDEARRLARAHPDVEFFVLETMHHVVKRDVDVTAIGRNDDPYGDGIPF